MPAGIIRMPAGMPAGIRRLQTAADHTVQRQSGHANASTQVSRLSSTPGAPKCRRLHQAAGTTAARRQPIYRAACGVTKRASRSNNVRILVHNRPSQLCVAAKNAVLTTAHQERMAVSTPTRRIPIRSTTAPRVTRSCSVLSSCISSVAA